MGTRGRQSGAEAEAAVVVLSDRRVERRPAPPPELTEEQAEEWRAVVSRMDATWFPRETHGMLAQYCRHIVAARRVAQLIAAAEEAGKLDVENYDRLLKMQEREGRALSSLATRMRISQQSLYDPRKKRDVQIETPWPAPLGR